MWFPWDRRAKKDGSDTCWMGVGQPWAGTVWGHQVIPRVGMECLISYQEGDPDRPFVTALVPDPTNPVPYTLPDNKTRMVFRSKSYKSSGNNEMTFEDARRPPPEPIRAGMSTASDPARHLPHLVVKRAFAR